jgi:tetratricopeptide (TPR) repeat protein
VNKTSVEKNWPYFIFFLAFALRLAYLIFLKNTYLFYGHPSDDVAYYQNWAQMITQGKTLGNSAFSGMPLFAYYLAMLLKICLGHWFAVNIMNLVLGSINCVLLYVLAKQLFSQRCAVVTALLAATNFILIYYDWLMMPVTLLITLSLCILLSLNNQAPKSVKDWLLLGVFIGLATLGDGKFLIFGALLIGYLGWTHRTQPIKQIGRIIIPLLLGLMLILGTVTVRNRIMGGEWIFITSQSGLSLYVGNNPQASGAFENPDFIRPSHTGQDEDQRIFVEKTLGKKVSLSQVSHFYRDLALNFITTQPWNYIKLLGKKLVLFVSDAEISHDIDLILQRDIKLKLDSNPYPLIFPLALLGIILAWQKEKQGRFAILIIVGHLIYCLIYFVTTRQRAPILPLLILFESYAFIWFIDRIQSRRIKIVLPTLIAVIAFVAFFPPQFIDRANFAFLNYTKTGSLYDEKKDYPKAQQSFAAALTLAPKDPNTLFNLGTAYLHQNQYQQAEQYLNRAIKYGQFNIDATFNLGYIYEQTDRTQMAFLSYQEVLNHAPNSLDALFRIAQLYQQQGQCRQAKPYYQHIIDLKPLLSEKVQEIFKNCPSKE